MPRRLLQSPVVVDGQVTEEKVAELLALETEYPELDFKRVIDLSAAAGSIEIAKDVAAMQILGGYILGGVDDRGRVTGEMDDADLRLFDQASLQQKMLRYMDRPLDVRSNVVERANPGEEGKHRVIVIFVGPNPAGCAFFSCEGTYEKPDGNTKTVFQKGDVFWRDGTRSTRLDQEGFEEIIERRIQRSKREWIAEQQEIRQQEREDRVSAQQGRQMAEGPLGSLNLDLPPRDLGLTALDLIRQDDPIALRHLLNEALARARAILDRGDVEGSLSELLDKLICLAAVLLEYDQDAWFDQVVDVLVEIYGMPVTEDQVRSFGYSSSISSDEIAPQVWLAILERIFALGGFAVRRKKWRAIRELTVRLPDVIKAVGYDRNWLRHGLTMASRAQHFEREDQTLSLLTLARNRAAELDCLRLDRANPDDDALLTSIVEFDFLSNVSAIDGSFGLKAGRVYYPNFARFYQDRVQGIANRLVTDPGLRAAIFTHSDADLAAALSDIGKKAESEGWRFDGFDGWEDTPVEGFIEAHGKSSDLL
jgi:hypothetical protein